MYVYLYVKIIFYYSIILEFAKSSETEHKHLLNEILWRTSRQRKWLFRPEQELIWLISLVLPSA